MNQTGETPKPPPAAPHAKKRIVIVDDHPVLRAGLSRLINSKDGFEVCGEAGSAAECMEAIATLKPDLVVVDIGLPDASGVELTKRIRAKNPKLPILILSMHEEPLYAMRALRAGAMGYIIKQDAVEKIAEALHQSLNGQRYISPSISGQLALDNNGGSGPGANNDLTDMLTDRELEIFELIGRGHEVRDIAKELRLSPKTVDTHRTHIKTKLKLRNARQVARFAVQWVAQHSS
jgi:DNA-binding NarL/FixJ family response regulator